MFVYVSSVDNTSEGVYVDDVLLQKVTNAPVTCYTLTTAASPTAGGSVAATAPNCLSDSTKYSSGTTVTLTATANSGYTFANWTGDATGTTSPATVNMTGNKSVTANFTATIPCYTLSKTASPSAGGSLTDSPAPNSNNNTQYTQGTAVTVTAVANPGYTFANWIGDGTPSGNTTSVTMSANQSVTANFTQNQYTVTISVVGSGSVTKSPDKANYVYGESVTLTATPVAGWQFSGWSGGQSGRTNPLTITVSGNTTATATFTQAQYTLTTKRSGQRLG